MIFMIYISYLASPSRQMQKNYNLIKYYHYISQLLQHIILYQSVTHVQNKTISHHCKVIQILSSSDHNAHKSVPHLSNRYPFLCQELSVQLIDCNEHKRDHYTTTVILFSLVMIYESNIIHFQSN
jgi:hypothetical protein